MWKIMLKNIVFSGDYLANTTAYRRANQIYNLFIGKYKIDEEQKKNTE